MIFDELEIVGFRSIIKPLTLKLNVKGVNVIAGGNGEGKTQMWNALAWVLYGKPLNQSTNVETFKELRPTKYTGVRVSIKIKDGDRTYQIIRTKNFKGLDGLSKRVTGREILLNGSPLNLDKYAAQKKEAIEGILGISFRVFKNSIMFGQKLKRLIEEAGGEQKDFFSEAFEVDFIKLARKNTEDRRTWLNSDLEPLYRRLTNAKDKHKNYKNSLVEDRRAKERFITSRDERVSVVRMQIEGIDEKILDLKQSIAKSNIRGKRKRYKQLSARTSDSLYQEKESLNSKMYELSQKIDNLEYDNKKLKTKLDELKVDNEMVCSECGQKLKPEIIEAHNNKRDELRKRLTKIYKSNKKEIETLKGQLDAVKGQYSSIQSEIDRNKSKVELLKKLEDGIKRVELWRLIIDQQKSNKEALKKQLNIILKEEYPTHIRRGLKKKVRKYHTLMDIYQTKIDPKEAELKLVEWALKDPLSNKGLNAYIFNSMLKALNQRLKHYSAIVGFKIQFHINLDSKRKEFYAEVVHRGSVKNYNELSGGEAQLVNIAIAFAINDVISESKNINLIVMDEAFEALDAKNIEVVSSMIELKAKNKALWLITHLKDFEITNSHKYKVVLSKEGTIISK